MPVTEFTWLVDKNCHKVASNRIYLVGKYNRVVFNIITHLKIFHLLIFFCYQSLLETMSCTYPVVVHMHDMKLKTS